MKEQLTDPKALNRVKQLGLVAADLGVPLTQLALAWCLKNPNVSTVITGASRVEQVRENMKAIEAIDKLSDDVMVRIAAILV